MTKEQLIANFNKVIIELNELPDGIQIPIQYVDKSTPLMKTSMGQYIISVEKIDDNPPIMTTDGRRDIEASKKVVLTVKEFY